MLDTALETGKQQKSVAMYQFRWQKFDNFTKQ